MPRIIVATDHAPLADDAAVLLDESVHSVHLSTGHAAQQLVERLAWAVRDAEAAEEAPPEPPRRLQEARPRHASARPRRRPQRARAGSLGS